MFIHKKSFLFYVFLVLSLLLISGLSLYFYKVKYIGDINVRINNSNIYADKINFSAITPTGKQQNFYKVNQHTYNVSGYYNAIQIYFDKSIKNQLNLNDTIRFEVNNTYYSYTIEDIFNNWTLSKNDDKIIYYLPPMLQNNVGILSKLNAALCFTDYAPVTAVIYIILCVFLILLFLIYLNIKDVFIKYYSKLKNIHILIVSCALTTIYFFAFLNITPFTNTVALSGDSWEYQVMAVNFAKGHGIQKLSLTEDFDTYKFDNIMVDEASLNDLKIAPLNAINTYRTPAYALFLGFIYKLCGINPYAVKVIQLLLMCFIAAFLPIVLKKIGHHKAYIVGIIGGFLFLLSHYQSSLQIMTEVLLMFFSFVCIWLIISNDQKKSFWPYFFTGIVLAILLLIKGVLIFVPLLFLSWLLYKYFKTKNKFFIYKFKVIALSLIITLLPWSVYASAVNKFILPENISKQEIRTATALVDSIFSNTIITKENIIAITDSITEIYYQHNYWDASRYIFVKDYIKKHPEIIENTYENTIKNAKHEMNTAYNKHLDYFCIPFFGKKYIYVNFKGFTLLTTQPRTLLLESNNEHCSDGGWHQEKKHESYYYKTDKQNYSSLVRVFKFYWHNPYMVFKIFPAKLNAGFKRFLFCQLLVILLIFNILRPHKHLFLYEFLSISIGIPLLLYLMKANNFTLPVLFISAFFLVTYQYLKNLNPYPFSVPQIFNTFFCNIILITLVFYGLDRFTFTSEFIVIPVSILFLMHKIKYLLTYNKTT